MFYLALLIRNTFWGSHERLYEMTENDMKFLKKADFMYRRLLK